MAVLLTVLVHQAAQDLDKVVVLLHVGHGAQVLQGLEAVVVRVVLWRGTGKVSRRTMCSVWGSMRRCCLA